MVFIHSMNFLTDNKRVVGRYSTINEWETCLKEGSHHHCAGLLLDNGKTSDPSTQCP